ncbi:MAG TPA: site-2 protease family protein [Gemmatimonadales bacterium]|nr:site-2 protease family protein [Gemmatimonadales bacterium]
MKWSYRIGTVAGTEIKVHVTFLLLLAWYGFSAWRAEGASAALASTLFLLALFGCVVVHEFGHILMARRFGVRTPDVILLPIGGVARLERIPEEPRQELSIAIAGPVVTLVIATALWGWLRLTGQSVTLSALTLERGAFVTRLMAVNLWLLAFNLLPAFPMDGGRMLRAALASRLGVLRATRLAGTIGQMLAVVMFLVGLRAGAELLALIALFVFLGAGAEMSAVETRVIGQGLRVSEMMVTRFHTIPIHATLAQVVDLLLSGEQREFPVVDNLGRTEGILTRDNLLRGLRERGPESIVAEAMTAPAPTVSPTLAFDEALHRLRSSGLPALPVVDGGGALVGLLTMDNISELLLVRRARAAR